MVLVESNRWNLLRFWLCTKVRVLRFDLLHLLARQPGRAYSRAYLLQRIWGIAYGGADRTVDAHVVRLRKKLGPFGDRLATVWGVGYKLRAD